MNEITKELAKEGLTFLKASKAFVVEQAPDFMRQLLAWKRVEHACDLFFAILMFTFAGFIAKPVARSWQMNNVKDDNPLMAVGGGIALALSLVFGLIVLCESATKLLEVIYAPKIYLLEYFAHALQ